MDNDGFKLSSRVILEHAGHSLKIFDMSVPDLSSVATLYCDTCAMAISTTELPEECGYTFSHTSEWCYNDRCRTS